MSAIGISPNRDKVKAVSDFPVPYNTKDFRSFLGVCSYFSRYAPGFADIASPLISILRKDIAFKWTQYCVQSFLRLKRILTMSAVLRHYTPNAPIELHTDASGDGIGDCSCRASC